MPAPQIFYQLNSLTEVNLLLSLVGLDPVHLLCLVWFSGLILVLS